jgi:hypothetical protein
MTSEKDKKINLVVELTVEYSKILSIDEIIANKLGWGKNGLGDRWMNKKFNYSVIYKSKKKPCQTYSENDDDEIPKELLDEFVKKNQDVKGGGIIGIFCHSKRTNIVKRDISEDIRKVIRSRSCVVCGSNTDIVCDHKNDIYNDDRVLDLKTQCIDDFQPLCAHCNLQKRQVCKDEKKNGKLYSAKNLKSYEIYGDFPWEKEIYDLNDINTKVGSFWYDPVEFNKNIKKLFIDQEK